MTGLAALRSARGILASPRRAARRIGARRLRRVARRPLDPTLELRDPLLLPGDLRRQLLDLRLKPLVLRRQRQQHLNDGIATLLIDRLGLGALHTPKFDARRLCPPDPLNAYGFSDSRQLGSTRASRHSPGNHGRFGSEWVPKLAGVARSSGWRYRASGCGPGGRGFESRRSPCGWWPQVAGPPLCIATS